MLKDKLNVYCGCALNNVPLSKKNGKNCIENKHRHICYENDSCYNRELTWDISASNFYDLFKKSNEPQKALHITYFTLDHKSEKNNYKSVYHNYTLAILKPRGNA